MERPAASIVIGVYNRSGATLACLDSLRAMDFDGRFEVVVVDDGSTDETPARLEAYRRRHPRLPLVIVRSDRNLGAAGARTLGIEKAAGEIVVFTDSDCTVDPGWLRELLGGFDDDGVGAVTGTVVERATSTLAERADAGSTLVGRKQPNLIEGNMGLRRELALRYRFDEALVYGAEGDDLARRMLRDGHRIAFVPAAVVHHRHPMGLRDYLSKGFHQGRGSARFWYKHDLYLGRDLLPLAAALVSSPAALLDPRLAAVPGFFLLLQLAAIVYNEVALKEKSVPEMLRVLPVSLLFYAWRAAGVFSTLARIALGGERAIRDSKRRWRGLQRSVTPGAAGAGGRRDRR